MGNSDESAATRPPTPDEVERTAYFAGIDRVLAQLEAGPPEAVAAAQFESLAKLLEHARRNTSYYAQRLDPVLPGGRFDARRWAEVPILTRRDVGNHYADLRATDVPDGMDGSVEMRSSASTGTPLTFATGRLVAASNRAIAERIYAWHGIDVTGVMINMKDIDGGRPSQGWSYRSREGDYLYCPVTALRSEQLAFLKTARRPRYLLTFPTLVRELAATAIAERETIPLDAVVTVGEVLTGDVRELCLRAFGAKVIDTYGCRELGTIAIQCDRSDLHHVCTSSVLLEVLDDFERPVGPGETGRAVVTSLTNYAMPLIRYEIGDYVRLAEKPCACGRPLPVFDEILGRQRDMLTLPDGNRVLLSGRVLQALARYVPLRQFRLVQRAPDFLELLYVPDGSGDAVDREGLRDYVRSAIHQLISIEAIPVRDIPRMPSGKYRDVVGLPT